MTKKILLTLGSVTAVVAPVATMVACGNENKEELKKFSKSFPKQIVSSKAKAAFEAAVEAEDVDNVAIYKKGDTIPGSVLGIVDAKVFNTKDIKVTYKVTGEALKDDSTNKTLKIQVEFKKGDLVETQDIIVEA